MAPSSEVSSIMEGMIFAFELTFLHQTAEIMTLERHGKYCGKIIHDPKWSSNSVLRNHPWTQNGGLLFASRLGLADIPIGTWAALNLLERWGKFPFSGLEGENHPDTMSALSWSRRFLLEMAAHSRTIPWWSGPCTPKGWMSHSLRPSWGDSRRLVTFV